MHLEMHQQKPAVMQVCATVLQLLGFCAVMHHSDNHKVSSMCVVQVQLHAEHFGRGSHQPVFDSFVCTLLHQTLHAGGHWGICSGQHVVDGRLFRPASPHRGRLLSTTCVTLYRFACLCPLSIASAMYPHVSSLCVMCLFVQVHSGSTLSDLCTSVCLLSGMRVQSQLQLRIRSHTAQQCLLQQLSCVDRHYWGLCCDLCASAELYICLQVFFGFFSKLNSYWVAPMVNLIFIVTAVLTQLFLATLWGKAVLAWLTPKHAFMKEALSSQPDKDSNARHSSNSSEADTEQQRLLASTHWNSMQSIGASEGHNATQLKMLYEGPTGMCVEMAQLDGQ